jgi:hypothetical protein
MIIEVEEAVPGETCDICEKADAEYRVEIIEKCLCRKCARKLSAVLRQGVQS